MRNGTKAYILSVIAAGCLVFTASLQQGAIKESGPFLVYAVFAVLASAWKVRLPHVEGTYSLNFLVLLTGIFRFSLVEVLVAASAAGLTQSVWKARQRPTTVQVAFNMSNLVLSVAVCFFAAHRLAAGLVSYRPAVLALVAFLYFVTNTLLVAGVLSLLQGKSLGEIWQDFYLWYLVYYLVGAALLGALPLAGGRLHPEAFLVVLPLLYLVHFYHGLADGAGRPKTDARAGAAAFASRLYLGAVIAAGVFLFLAAVWQFKPADTLRFAIYLLIAMVASACKVRLPGVTGTLSVGFVMLLVAISELSFGEAVAASAFLALVQCLWKPQRRPGLVQVSFSMASVVIGAAAAYQASQWARPGASASLPTALTLATTVLYGTNTLLIAGALRLVERKPLGVAWSRCHFWSFPYYLVGTAAAGLVIYTSRASGWQPSLLVLPVLLLVHVSYRLQVSRATAQQPA